MRKEKERESQVEKFSKKEKLFEKYGLIKEDITFECTIEEKRHTTFRNEDERNVDHAYVAVFDNCIVIIKESVWIKSDMGMRKVYFNNVSSIDYDTRGKLGASSSLLIHMNSGEYIHLKHISKENVDKVHEKFENFIIQKNNSTINQKLSNADELLKYADLYKQGFLTEEEFEAKKKELL